MRYALIYSLALVVTLAGAPAALAQDACYADYKAKRETGRLELHYGVVRVDPAICGDRAALARNVAGRIAVDGWTLLRILSTFSEDELNAKRADAADYFLRY